MIDALNIENLHVSYRGNEVIRDINLSVKSGNLIGILGPNGAGKSTLIKAILGLIPIDKGIIKIQGEKLNKIRHKIAYVPQRSNIDWDFPIIVKDTVLLGTYPSLGLFKRPSKDDKELVMECLEKVGMEDYANTQISQLSGGQQQRVFIARALAQKAESFYLDEPFIGIDVSSEEVIVNILRGLRDEGKTVFVVHHDLMKAQGYFDEIILINKVLKARGPVAKIFQRDILEETYQASLPRLSNSEVK